MQSRWQRLPSGKPVANFAGPALDARLRAHQAYGMAKPLAKLISMLTPKRRWAQFSLLTLFLVVTVLCVGLRLVVVPAENQRRAVSAIRALGGYVEYAEADDGTSEASLRLWLPQDYFDEVRVVDLSTAQDTDAGLAHLQGLTGLQVLWLSNTQVTDAGLAHLHGLTALQDLILLGSTQVTDTGLAHLQGLTALKELWLSGTQVTDAGRAQFRQALPNCRIFGQ